MKIFIKFIYSLVFGILGAALFVIAFISFYTSVISILYMCLFGDGNWPEWARVILTAGSNPIVSYSIYLIGFFIGMFCGAKYIINFKKAHLWIKWGGD